MGEILGVARRELDGFFASPAAFLFLGAFLFASLFVFFWVEAFFARNIADVRPLFEWMPILLIFLVAALTMRGWSEERRSGTLETLLTSPVLVRQLVVGKFLGVLALVVLALILTVPLPITVALLGPLDLGPLVGGYVAAVFLAAAYAAIGLFTSARTDNPIVALIATAGVCGAFYLLGSPVLANLLGHQGGAILALLGSGTRFESITRGVLDLRDLYYYLSIVLVFLVLNIYSLERLRWVGNRLHREHQRWILLTGLAIANLLVANVWLAPVTSARADITERGLHSLSEATDRYLGQLQEPMTIRGYFSARTHPLLSPLVPQVQDLLREYEISSDGKVRVEFIDPHDDPKLEEEAAGFYGIQPVPFQVASRHESSVVSSYFDIVISYGDVFEVLGFRDLIEVKARADSEIDVLLKNPEYAITRTIRKVVNEWQTSGNLFSTLQVPVEFVGYISAPSALPTELATLRSQLKSVLDELAAKSDGKFTSRFEDPGANNGALGADLKKRYGFAQQVVAGRESQRFWFYMVLEGGDDVVQVPLPEGFDEAGLRQGINAGLQRFAPGLGFLRTIGVVKPQAPPPEPDDPSGQPAPPPQPPRTYGMLTDALKEDAEVVDVQLSDGVPNNVDLLLVLGPENLVETDVFAVDQFLMQGGTVVLAASGYEAQLTGALVARNYDTGLEDWLRHNGITFGNGMVIDPSSGKLPVPVERRIGNLRVREIRMLQYPHFPDIRGVGLNGDHPITAALDQLTLNWASPVKFTATGGNAAAGGAVDPAPDGGAGDGSASASANGDAAGKPAAMQAVPLLRSSTGSWVSGDLNVVPDFDRWPEGFERTTKRGAEVLAMALQGRFESYFTGRQSPLAQASAASATADGGDGTAAADGASGDDSQPGSVAGVIEHSPNGARLVVIGSNSFASDRVLELASQGAGTVYTQPLDFLANAVDWALEDEGLLAIRSRARFARMLKPMRPEERAYREYMNYGLAVVGLALVWGWRLWVRRRRAVRHAVILGGV